MYYFHSRLMPNLASPSSVTNAFDRTHTLFSVPEVSAILPVGCVDHSQPLSDICANRAQGIVSAAAGKKIYVFWSGGIDSTLALVALIQAGATPSLCVVMNQESIDEYPEFYYQHIENKILTKIIHYQNQFGIVEPVDTYLADGVVVTGELGDQMCGSGKYLHEDPEKLLSPWEDALCKTKSFEKYQRFANSAPIEINTLKDLWWWFNYAVKYNYVAFRMLRTSRNFKLEENVFHFFNTVEFNDWCVSTPIEEKFFGTDIKKYKQPFKDYIYGFTKDLNYQQNKTKLGSLQTVYVDLNPFSNLKEWTSVSIDGLIT